MLDDILEFVIELIAELCFELCSSTKLPKWVRYPLLAILGLFFLAFFALLYFLSYMAWRYRIWLGLLCIVLTSVLLLLGIRKFRKEFLEKKDEASE